MTTPEREALPSPAEIRATGRLHAALYTRADLLHSLLVALVVGALLIAINLGPENLIRPGNAPGGYLRYFLDYLIPFLVASASTLLANRGRSRRQARSMGGPRSDRSVRADSIGAAPTQPLNH